MSSLREQLDQITRQLEEAQKLLVIEKDSNAVVMQQQMTSSSDTQNQARQDHALFGAVDEDRERYLIQNQGS